MGIVGSIFHWTGWLSMPSYVLIIPNILKLRPYAKWPVEVLPSEHSRLPRSPNRALLSAKSNLGHKKASLPVRRHGFPLAHRCSHWTSWLEWNICAIVGVHLTYYVAVWKTQRLYMSLERVKVSGRRGLHVLVPDGDVIFVPTEPDLEIMVLGNQF